MTMMMTMPMPAMPMMPMMPMLMASMTMECRPGQAVCRLACAQGTDKDAFQNGCDMMQLMLKAGMPMVMQCGNLCLVGAAAGMARGMPLPMTMGTMPAAMCQVAFDIEDGGMVCRMTPGRDTEAAVFDSACQLLDKMMRMGMPMTMVCNGMPVMCCTAR